jgi:hypothetical protein
MDHSFAQGFSIEDIEGLYLIIDMDDGRRYSVDLPQDPGQPMGKVMHIYRRNLSWVNRIIKPGTKQWATVSDVYKWWCEQREAEKLQLNSESE